MKIKLILTLFFIAIVCVFCSCSQKYDSYNENSFIGTWNSSQVGKINLYSDGTWRVSKCNFGKWFLRDNNIVWIYPDKIGEEDINPILKFKPNEFVIREMNGSTTVFRRIKQCNF